MSTLWTPGGERPVSRDPQPQPSAPPYQEAATGVAGDGGQEIDEAEVEARLDELRDQLAETPVDGVVAQMSYQLFEVAALHLSLQPPQLDQAQLAIDAMAGLVETLGDRLGPNATPLRDGLSQIRMAFVQIKGQVTAAGDAPPSPPTVPSDPAPPQS